MTAPVIVTTAVLRDWALPAPGEDKGSRGQVVVLGGDTSTPGAVRLAGEAALRVGAGKLALATVDRHAAALGTLVPESAVLGLTETEDGAIDPDRLEAFLAKAGSAQAVLVGPGFVDPDPSNALVGALLPQLAGLDVGVVLDAMATGFLGEAPDALHRFEGRAVVCANPSELARVAGCESDEVSADPVAVSLDVARRVRAVVLCGGTQKTIATPDGRVWVVEAGGPGLGVSGSGDVQSGLVAGALARGAEPEQAAVWGGWLHARAGERLSARIGTLGFLARELPGEVPAVLTEVG